MSARETVAEQMLDQGQYIPFTYYTNNNFYLILDSGRRIIKVTILIVGHMSLYTIKELQQLRLLIHRRKHLKSRPQDKGNAPGHEGWNSIQPVEAERLVTATELGAACFHGALGVLAASHRLFGEDDVVGVVSHGHVAGLLLVCWLLLCQSA